MLLATMDYYVRARREASAQPVGARATGRSVGIPGDA
jgi:hypothetical protein